MKRTMKKLLLATTAFVFVATVAHGQPAGRPGLWQLPDYGRGHGYVTEPGMPKCNMAVSEECRRLYGNKKNSGARR
jgi:hypothetical protein